jgi:antitoxin MazE
MPSSITDQPPDNELTEIRPWQDLASLFGGKPAEEWRAAYAGAYDWGPDVGLEVVEE